MFNPHTFNTKIEVDCTVPKIFITPEAYDDMWALVDILTTEVGWYGMVTRVNNDYLITKILMPEQEVTAVTVELDPTKIIDEFLAQPNSDELLAQWRFWGHSHVNMGTTASGVDDKQMDTFHEGCKDYFIRGIFNKAGRAEFDIYDWANKLTFRDVSWSILRAADDTRLEHWKKEIAAKVKTPVYKPLVPSGLYSGGYSAYGGPGYKGPANPEFQAPRRDYQGFDNDYDYEFEQEIMRASRPQTAEDEYFTAAERREERIRRRQEMQAARKRGETLRFPELEGPIETPCAQGSTTEEFHDRRDQTHFDL